MHSAWHIEELIERREGKGRGKKEEEGARWKMEEKKPIFRVAKSSQGFDPQLCKHGQVT